MAEISDEAVEAAAKVLFFSGFDARYHTEEWWNGRAHAEQRREAVRDARAALTAALPFLEAKREPKWQPIETVPHDRTVILANFKNRCLLTGAPHVWTATYTTKWRNLKGEPVEADPMWCECSFAATNENGDPTHWTELLPSPELHPDWGWDVPEVQS